MNNGQITHLAAECMLYEELSIPQYQIALEKFALRVAEFEREQCAALCDAVAHSNKDTVILRTTAECCAQYIRERSKFELRGRERPGRNYE